LNLIGGLKIMSGKNTVALVIGAVILFIGMIIFFASTTIVPTGHIGVVTLYSKVQDKYLDAGFHFVKPFVESVHDVDIRTQKYSNTVEGSAKDLQIVNITMSINYQIKAEKASELYSKVGANYNDVILNPALQSSLKASIAKYTAEEMVTKRAEVATTITEELNKALEEYFIISAVNLENIGFTDEYNKAVEAKTTNQQKAEAEKAQLEIIKVQNEQKINTAEAEAKVRELQSQSVTDKSLEQLRLEIQREMIQKWNGSFPTTMLGDDPTMLFNLNK
jgi:regulator of protease activity HflC (stomatin/prohibitin superfamily)